MTPPGLIHLVDLSEKKSDLRVCDDSTCRYGGICRDDGAQLKCVCQFQVCDAGTDMVCRYTVYLCVFQSVLREGEKVL